MTTRRQIVFTLGAGAFSAQLTSFAQQSPKVWRIGFLSTRSRPASLDRDYALGGFLRGLQELGYVDGKNITIEWRFADDNYERIPGLATELVQLKVDVILAATSVSALAAQRATTTIPIVFVHLADPIGIGLVASFSRPGGNITGIANLGVEISRKYLELLRALTPKSSRVAVLWHPNTATSTKSLEEVQAAAKTAGVSVSTFEASTPAQIESAFGSIARARPGALIVLTDPLFNQRASQIAEFAAKNRLPAIYGTSVYVAAGGLMSYGANLAEDERQAAHQVDKILKGAKPADIPVEQPTQFELAVNMKTAKALGTKIPTSILVQATRVIE